MNDDTLSRFWSKVRKTDGCWLWTASKRHKGYGAFVWADESGRVVQGRAHRFSWEIHNGPIPDGLCVLHRCDVPACVNPDHLFLGTKAENNADMLAKGRDVKAGTYGLCKFERGERHHAAKMSWADVREIRSANASGESLGSIGRRYGTNASHIWKIVHNRLWKIDPGCTSNEVGS